MKFHLQVIKTYSCTCTPNHQCAYAHQHWPYCLLHYILWYRGGSYVRDVAGRGPGCESFVCTISVLFFPEILLFQSWFYFQDLFRFVTYSLLFKLFTKNSIYDVYVIISPLDNHRQWGAWHYNLEMFKNICLTNMGIEPTSQAVCPVWI